MIHGSVKVETFCGDEVTTIPASVKEVLFRIGQEDCQFHTHAGPSVIRIRVQHHRSYVWLSVEDDGAGFVTDRQCEGLGLRGMLHRAESISARLVIRSVPRSGTRIEVRAPIKTRFDIVCGAFYKHSHSDC